MKRPHLALAVLFEPPHHIQTFKQIECPIEDDPFFRETMRALALAESTGGDVQAPALGMVSIHRPLKRHNYSYDHQVLDDHTIRLIGGRLHSCVSLECDAYRFFNVDDDQLLKEVTLLIFIPFFVGLLVVGFIGAVIWIPLAVIGLFITGVWGGLKTRRELLRATDGPLSWVILTFPFLPMKRPMLLFDIWTVTGAIAITAFMFAAMAV